MMFLLKNYEKFIEAIKSQLLPDYKKPTSILKVNQNFETQEC